jgi:hypothetical protein
VPVTFPRLGRAGRFGNQLWQISGTMVLGDGDVSFPAWPYAWWFRFPDVFDGREGPDAADLSGLPRGRAEYLQEARYIHPRMRVWLEPSDAAEGIVERLVASYEPATATAVHVRRGDYADGNRGHGMLGADWYLANWPDGRVLVFSDDPDWCAANLPGEVVREPEVESWLTMARCRAHVISNSSFAWWAAWWAGGPVTYPVPWFTGLPYGDMFPDGWNGVGR